MNKHNFYIILLSFPHQLTAYIVTDVKKTHIKTTTGPELANLWFTNYIQWTKSSLLPVYLNEVLLKHSPIHSFTPYLWLCLPMNSRVEYLQQKAYGPQSQKYLLLALYKKVRRLLLQITMNLQESRKMSSEKNVSPISRPTLKKRREEGIFFNGEWNVRDTTVSQSLQQTP